ncbi:bacterioferritin-associated ferredoxin [Catenulispora sp. GP43]|uniref:(2Fe-2S)-binding protein n=1 Tax=Catenulispora sp. GP43 TaxID=3156263 RepID=UPI003513C292
MYACICHAVTTAEVDAAVALGAKSVKQVRKATGAGSACGTCVKRLSCLLAAARVADSAPADVMPEAERLPEAAPAPVPAARPATPVFQHAPHCPAAVPALG